MNFTNDQQKAIDIRGIDTLVSASAGSGKTRVLVERLCQLILQDKISVDHILAMTFTNDAAAEMKVRLRTRLQEEPLTPFIKDQLTLLENADISTIDSFCLKLVKNYYYKIPISLKMANSTASQTQSREAFSQGVDQAIYSVETTHLRSYLSAMNKTLEDLEPSIQSCINTAWSKSDPVAWIRSIQSGAFQDKITAWFETYFQEQVQCLLELCEQGIGIDPIFEAKKEALQACVNVRYPDFYPAFKNYVIHTGYMRATKKTQDKDLFDRLKKPIVDIEKTIEPLLFRNEIFEDDEKEMQPVLHEFCELVLETKKQYDLQKQAMEIIDFNDMEMFAYKLLQNDIIQKEISDQYQAILIDEFQDTNELQESIIASFAKKGTVFRVGDIKQSIYGFRQASPAIMERHMRSADECTLYMDKNFRSNANIIQFNNAFYEKIMNSALLGEHFVHSDIAQVGVEAQSQREQHPIRFLYSDAEAWAEQTGANKRSAHSKHKQNRLDVLAHDIQSQHEKGVAYRDICILTRTHAPQDEIIQTLSAYGIPCVGQTERGFYQDASVQIVLATLSALVDPYDEISLCAALCSPIGQIELDQLASLDHSQPLSIAIDALAGIENWKKLVETHADDPSECLRQIYAWNNFYFDDTTAQSKTNLDALLVKSQEWDRLSDFVHALKTDAKADKVSQTNPYDRQDDVVQTKTMHQSKGLQFPVVYILSQHEHKDHNKDLFTIDADLGLALPSLVRQGRIQRRSRAQIAFATKKTHDELEEEMRLFYVATTRAEKELIFVDTLEKISDYEGELSTHALLKKKSYTSWLFHTYYQDPHSPVQFIPVPMYERPEIQKPPRIDQERSTYTKPAIVFENQTASASKVSSDWPAFELKDRMASLRGTLFHEIMGQCSFPYQEKEIARFAKERGYTLSSTDKKQLLAINRQPLYQAWMEGDHQFECSYLLKNENQIVHGFMDLVIFEKDTITILDFKTDAAQKEELIERYASQLKTYARSMRKIAPDRTVKTWIYSFHLDEMIAL